MVTAEDGKKEKKIPSKSPQEAQWDRRLAKLEENQAKNREETVEKFRGLNATLKDCQEYG